MVFTNIKKDIMKLNTEEKIVNLKFVPIQGNIGNLQ